MKKNALIAIIIIFLFIVIVCVSFHLWRSNFHKRAEIALNTIITAISQDLKLSELSLDIDSDVIKEDFSPDYTITQRDYTWGTWEFWVEFANGSVYYFDFSEYEGHIRARVDACSK